MHQPFGESKLKIIQFRNIEQRILLRPRGECHGSVCPNISIVNSFCKSTVRIPDIILNKTDEKMNPFKHHLIVSRREIKVMTLKQVGT